MVTEMMDASVRNDDKVAHFQALTGLQDTSLCAQILEAHSWDLNSAVTSMVDGEPQASPQPYGISDRRNPWSPTTAAHLVASEHDFSGPSTSSTSLQSYNGRPQDSDRFRDANQMAPNAADPGLAWKIITLPFSIIRSGYNVMYGAFGLGIWIASGVLSHSLGALGLGPVARVRAREAGNAPLLPTTTAAAEALLFVRNFESEYGEHHPAFQTTSFMDSLRRSREEFRFLFVYLHSPEHQDTPNFCEQTLCSEAVVQFLDENFIAWGADVRCSEGFRMCNSLKASTFPFCALVMASSDQQIALLQQVEGPKSAEELLAVLQNVVEEQGTALVAGRIEEEERRLNRRLREEQDAAYQAALLADQERESQRQQEAELMAREASEVERQKKEEEEAAAQEAAEREAALERRRHEKAMTLELEPERGPNVTEVLVRLPNGDRMERRFNCTATILSVYDYVDSLHCFDAVRYTFVSNFPRVVYGPDKFGLSLKDAGLHPRASLYVQVEDS